MCGAIATLAASVMINIGCQTVKTTVNDTIDAITPGPSGPGEVDRIRKEPDIRVRIARQSQGHTLAGPERFLVRSASSAGSAAQPVTLKGPVAVSSSAKGVTTISGDGVRREWGFGVDIEVHAGDGAGGTGHAPESIRMDERLLPGYLTLRPLWSENADRMDIIVTMPIESYLPGVLAKELPKAWPRQTFAAQAVASRTYALQERSRARATGKLIDVEDTTADQVFGGTGSHVEGVEAVRATRGWVLSERGDLIRAYFSSQCGGRSASAKTAWTSKTPPPFNTVESLQGGERVAYCQRAPQYRWTLTRKSDEINKRLRAWGRGKGSDLANITKLRRIEVAERNEAGRPTQYTIVSDNEREYTVAPEELREACNWPVQGLAPITRENRVSSGDIEVTVVATDVRFVGRGFGHGVGMCQWCAKGMGDAGKDWRSMVEDFYPGVEVKKLY